MLHIRRYWEYLILGGVGGGLILREGISIHDMNFVEMYRDL